jgi:regulator of RNase E activity RraA
MDEMGLPLVVGADVIQPRTPGSRIAGHAVTLRYLPERRRAEGETSRFAHHVAFDLCSAGDVLVIEAPATVPTSTFGGMAALEASRRGLAGVIVDGAVRDVDEIESIRLPVWSRSVTPRTGKWRLEAVQINSPVCCGGQQVVAGDLVLADASGVCFIPIELAETAARRVLEVAQSEQSRLGHDARY